LSEPGLSGLQDFQGYEYGISRFLSIDKHLYLRYVMYSFKFTILIILIQTKHQQTKTLLCFLWF